MQSLMDPCILVEKKTTESRFLDREVKIDIYKPSSIEDPEALSLLLINDGQDMPSLGFETILDQLYRENAIQPLLCVGIHCGVQRKMEYGIAGKPDYKGRGARADLYTSFILQELLPLIADFEPTLHFKEIAFAGFSLGGLSAMDIAWNNPTIFKTLGLFSGSFWWRSIDQTEEEYDDEQHRIMHQMVRNGQYHPGQRFFFQCGNLDESRDRNQNGIIDSIDDTQDLIRELTLKGYEPGKDIAYLEIPDGRHDVPTWGRAMPSFLKWGWPSGVPLAQLIK